MKKHSTWLMGITAPLSPLIDNNFFMPGYTKKLAHNHAASLAPDPIFLFCLCYKGTQILNSYEYITGLNSWLKRGTGPI